MLVERDGESPAGLTLVHNACSCLFSEQMHDEGLIGAIEADGVLAKGKRMHVRVRLCKVVFK